jgi:hypothetical protein
MGFQVLLRETTFYKNALISCMKVIIGKLLVVQLVKKLFVFYG